MTEFLSQVNEGVLEKWVNIICLLPLCCTYTTKMRKSFCILSCLVFSVYYVRSQVPSNLKYKSAFIRGTSRDTDSLDPHMLVLPEEQLDVVYPFHGKQHCSLPCRATHRNESHANKVNVNNELENHLLCQGNVLYSRARYQHMNSHRAITI